MIKSGENTVCYGCGVCVLACPQNIIEIKLSLNGFYIPFIENVDKCTECKICEGVCSYLDNSVINQSDKIKALGFSGVNKNRDTLKQSTSGGVGIEIAKLFINKGHKACGVRYDSEEKIAKHFVSDNILDYKLSIGSKYIQSFTVEGFSYLKNKNNKYAVFGAPCQIDSLRRFAKFKKREDNFLFVDFFCHGVPSYHLWDKYLAYLSTKINVNDNASFVWRDKKYGWHNFTFKVENKKLKYYSTLKRNNLFLNMFLGNYCLNECCYTCKFRLNNSSADIRIGDMWGRKYSSNDDGVSSILALTEKGIEVVDELKQSCLIKKEKLSDIWEGQMKHSYPIPTNRGLIIDLLKEDKSLTAIYIRYGYKMWVKNMIPTNLKSFIKKIIKN